MNLLTFQGYSDDTFACEGRGIDVDHDNCANGDPIRMRVQAGKQALIVSGQYAPGPCAGWLIGVSPADFFEDEQHIPDWPMNIVQSDREYSPKLVISAPDDVFVQLIDEDGDEKVRA